LDATELRDILYRFYVPLQASPGGVRGLWKTRVRVPGRGGVAISRTRIMHILRFFATALLAVLLAVATWLLVAEQVNPAKTEVMQEIPLRVANQDKDLLLVSALPTTVSAVVQAPQDIMANLSPQSFRATVDLSGLKADVHRVQTDVRATDERVRIVTVDPTAVDVELQPKASRAMTVSVVVPDRDTLPFSYEIGGTPRTDPPHVTVSGPADIMDALARTEVVIPLRGARSTVQEDRAVLLKDLQGQVLTGLTADPDTVQVTVPISQSFNTRDVAVHVVITGTVAPGYWISNINVDPNTVTLLGAPAVLEQIGGFVDTIPVDVTGAAGDIVRRVPLAPPAGVSALNQRGVSEASVEARITVVPQLGNLRLTVPVEINGARQTDTISKSPASVDVLLSGPLPVLNQVNADPKLVRVVVDVTDLGTGTHDLIPTLIAPELLRTTMVPGTVQIRLQRPEETSTPGPTAVAPRP
jgi:YbbR domain-containing protein